jgi:phage tail-like protein
MGSVLFESCTGLTTEVGVMLIGDAQSGMGTRAVRSGKVSGKIHFEKTLSSQSAELTRWFLDVLNPEKKLKRMNLHLTIRSNKSDNPIASKWRIQNAWPCSWSGPILDTSQSGIALESVTFIHEGITPILD